MSLETGANHGMGLDRLLVEQMRGSSPRFQKPLEPIGRKCPSGAIWCIREPAQTLETNLEKIGLIRPAARHDQSMGKSRIVVSHDVFEPEPIRAGNRFVAIAQTLRQFCAKLIGHEIAAQRAKVFVQADDRERPCPRRRETLHRRQCLLEKLRRPGAQSLAPGAADAGAKSP